MSKTTVINAIIVVLTEEAWLAAALQTLVCSVDHT